MQRLAPSLMPATRYVSNTIFGRVLAFLSTNLIQRLPVLRSNSDVTMLSLESPQLSFTKAWDGRSIARNDQLARREIHPLRVNG